MRSVTIFLIVILCAATASASGRASQSGMEVRPGTKVYIMWTDESHRAAMLGLKEDMAKLLVRLTLERFGIQTGTEKDSHEQGLFLHVVANVTPEAYSVRVCFNRIVGYEVNGKALKALATMQEWEICGLHGRNKTNIVTSMISQIEEFCADFVKVNTHIKAPAKK